MHRQAVAIFSGTAQSIDIGNVEFGVDPIHKQVHGQVHNVDVASALTIAKQSSFNTVGAGHHAELGSSNSTTTVVVWVQRQHNAGTVFNGAAKPLNNIAIYVG